MNAIEEVFVVDLPAELASSSHVQALIQLVREQAQIIQKQAEQIVELKEQIDELKDEIDRLRKTPKRPKFKPGGMEPRNRSQQSNQGKSNRSSVEVSSPRKREEVVIPAQDVPHGSRFKGYSNFSVEEAELVCKQVVYRLEVWQAPDGKVIRAHLPETLQGKHFGVGLRTLATVLYAHGITQPALFDFLRGAGVQISSGQLNNLLLSEAEKMSQLSEEILSTGLSQAPYIRVDDTGDKHEHRNAYCTHIGGEYFAYYKTSFTKSRLNFLTLLLQSTPESYFINDAMIWHLYQSGVEDDILNIFEESKGKQYRSKRGLNRLLNAKGIAGKRVRARCLEAALIGFISETLLHPGQVLLSDRAGQFAVFNHAACWIHMERPLRKIPLTTPQVEKEWQEVRAAIWTLYNTLKQAALTQTNRDTVYELYDKLVTMKTSSPRINEVIESFGAYREEMLKALDHPGLPLHNNDSERDLRGVAKRRKLSGSTKSECGRMFRDSLMSLKQTCFRLNLNFWDFSLEWFRGKPPDLAKLISQRYQAACS